jgi:hypothetical protein
MKWLAIKHKSTGEYFIQDRDERELSLNYLMDRKKIIPTMVIKKFKNKHDARRYCDAINAVNEMVKNI